MSTSIAQLKDMSRRLRGSGPGDDSADILQQVKEFATSVSGSLRGIQNFYQDGNTQAAGASLKILVGDTDTLTQTAKETKQISGADLREASHAISSGMPVALSDVPDDLFGQVIHPQAFDKLVEFSGEFAESFNSLDVSVTAPTGGAQSSHKNTNRFTHINHGNKNEGFDFLSHPQSYFKHHMQHHQKGFSLPNVSIFFSAEDQKIIMAKHQVRQDALGEDTCPPEFEVTDWAGNCGKLFSCVEDMTEYDMLVLGVDGFIDTQKDSETFGELTLHANELNLYDMDHDIRTKLAEVKSLVTEDPTQEQCNAVLERFHSACDPSEDACSKANQQSFQVSTEKVCASVNTKVKVKFEAIGDEFDGFVDTPSQGKFVIIDGGCESCWHWQAF